MEGSWEEREKEGVRRGSGREEREKEGWRERKGGRGRGEGGREREEEAVTTHHYAAGISCCTLSAWQLTAWSNATALIVMKLARSYLYG